MAFRIKKRPSPLQAAMGGFASGFGAGIQQGTQNRLKAMLEAEALQAEQLKQQAGYLQKAITQIQDPEVKAKAESYLVRGMIPEGVDYIAGQTGSAYTKPETTDFTKRGEKFQKGLEKVAKLKGQHITKTKIAEEKKEKELYGYYRNQIRQLEAKERGEGQFKSVFGDVLPTGFEGLGLSEVERRQLEIARNWKKNYEKRRGIEFAEPETKEFMGPPYIEPEKPITATNPQTGEKLKFVNGKWVPIR